MKPHSRTISTLAGAACAAIFLIPSPAPGVEENFFQKFVVQEPMNWSGPYIGFNNGATFNNLHVGHHMTDVDVTEQFYDLEDFPGVAGDTFDTFDPHGHNHSDTETIGGGQTGYKFQFGHIVVGAEGSIIGNGTSGRGTFHDFQESEFFIGNGDVLQQPVSGNIAADTEFKSTHKIETTWNGFVGGNIGFAWNRFLIYGAGGAAFTDVHIESTDVADTTFFSNCGEGCDGGGVSTPVIVGRRTPRLIQPQQGEFEIGEIVSKKTHTQGDVLTGWYGGGGVDYALTKFVSVGLEYKHVDWGGVTEHQIVGPNGGPVFTGNGHLDLDADQVLFKVNILIGALGH
jgi:opacity protein-like surface antigen